MFKQIFKEAWNSFHMAFANRNQPFLKSGFTRVARRASASHWGHSFSAA